MEVNFARRKLKKVITPRSMRNSTDKLMEKHQTRSNELELRYKVAKRHLFAKERKMQSVQDKIHNLFLKKYSKVRE